MSHSKKMILITIASLGLSSCSSIEKSMIYSGIAGAVIGGFVGRYASPDRESDKINIAIGSMIGGVGGASVGAYFYKLDPDNRNMKTMLNGSDVNKNNPKNFEIGVPISEKFYTITPDTSKIPEHLKDKVKKQIIIEKTIPERVVNGEGGKSTLIPETKVIEFDYQ
jgi:hypothetical protein